jgi:small nuclear ribonucleoprotein (snRNP)-like protein
MPLGVRMLLDRFMRKRLPFDIGCRREMTKDYARETAIRSNTIRRDFKQQLNPHEWPGHMSLIYELDSEVCVITEDGETVVGELSSYDQFGNVVLRRARGRQFTPQGIQDLTYGYAYFRAERVVLVGQVDKDKEAKLFAQYSAEPVGDPDR